MPAPGGAGDLFNDPKERGMRWKGMIVWTLAAGLLATGCASKKYVREEVGRETAAVHTRVDTLQGQVEATQTKVREHDEQIAQVSKTAQEALQRAQEAGKLAEGKLLYETVLSDDKVHFPFDRSALSDEARAALDTFAQPLVGDNQNIYIEIQGHTDSVGSDQYNNDLGLERAEAVRRYLNMQHHIPLHRMAVISYGETAPVTDNKSRDHRSQNRRVVLVVLK
ncbi:MAG TPA: OmpA family protein [Thermoanaerobaculia bacterium]|nr:OmpA family protein [Thermoanaerobaculia bacterium]